MKRISFLKFVVFAWLASALWVHAQGQFTTFDAPGAGTRPGQGTLAAAINAAGTVSGMYWDANYVTHGFVRAADGSFATFDPPGSAYVIADTLGINSAGTVVEQYVDANSVGHGALRTA